MARTPSRRFPAKSSALPEASAPPPPASAPQVAAADFSEEDGPLLSLYQLGRKLGVCQMTIRRWATKKEPRLRVVKRFGVMRTKLKWYEEWLAAQNQE